ncbi:hypothetical protein [Nodosilinea nodulosa]|uniref:hypothetical protein n=1 Tax=Nodosilinea nodulosa TaxID=416001 RepID=UPI0002F20879|nr:hypothetical protein [Nodosilinea nodulosa]
MNTKLVDSLLQVIESLSEAERSLLYNKLDRKAAWKASQNRLRHLHQRLQQGDDGSMANLPIADLINQERQQRDQVLLSRGCQLA